LRTSRRVPGAAAYASDSTQGVREFAGTPTRSHEGRK
jgi:hypothetical protein